MSSMNGGRELDSRVSEIKDRFGGLLDDETVDRIARSNGGKPMAEVKKIADLKDREEVSLVVKVNKVQDVKEFKKRTGGSGRVRNLGVEDESGTCRLTLWDDDVDLPEGMDIQVGTQLRLTDCYAKQSDFGLDVSKGKKGKIEKL